MQENRHFPNRLGIGGWVNAGRYGIERYLYTLQRLSGLGLILFLLLHLVETSSRLRGAAAWEATMAGVASPLFKVLEYVVMAGFLFHATNGVRLILEELGPALGKPARPIYPYTSSIQRQRPLMWALMVVVVVLLGLSAADFFVW